MAKEGKRRTDRARDRRIEKLAAMIEDGSIVEELEASAGLVADLEDSYVDDNNYRLARVCVHLFDLISLMALHHCGVVLDRLQYSRRQRQDQTGRLRIFRPDQPRKRSR